MDEAGALDLQVMADAVTDKLTGKAPDFSVADEFPNFGNGEAKRKWFKLDEIVVVFADLKNSTALGVNKHDKSTARIYEASTGVGVRLLQNFHPKYVEVQGDGFFGVFHGDRADVKAMTAAMMLAHFSKYILEPQIKKSREAISCPETGLKLGVTTGRTLVKQIGVPGFERPVWAGKPVNYSAKCAEFGEAHQVIVMENLYKQVIEHNDYFLQPCYHRGHPKGHNSSTTGRWRPVKVPAIAYKCLASDVPWCNGDSNGNESAQTFAEKVLAGEHNRSKSWADRNLRS